jgi:hypothetical protein
MIRKLLVVAAAIALPVSLVAVSGGIAGASNSHTAATDTIVCKDLAGTLAFSPTITKKGHTSGKEKTTVSATLSDCKVSGQTAITVTKGTVKGSFTGATGTAKAPVASCASLASGGTESGTLTTTWTATAGGPVAPTVRTIKSEKRGTAGGHSTFTIPGTVKGSATGSFGGSNSGASDTTTSETTLTTSALATACLTKGLSSVAIRTDPGVTAVSLG